MIYVASDDRGHTMKAQPAAAPRAVTVKSAQWDYVEDLENGVLIAYDDR